LVNVRLLRIRVAGLEVLANQETDHYDDRRCEQGSARAKRYDGLFLAIGTIILPFVRIPCIPVYQATLDVTEWRNRRAIMTDNHNLLAHAHYQNDAIQYLERRGFLGKLYENSYRPEQLIKSTSRNPTKQTSQLASENLQKRVE